MHSNMKQIFFLKMALLSQILHVPSNFEISRIGEDQVWGTTLLL